MYNYDEMGQRIRYYREARNYLQTELAEKIGISNKELSRIELCIEIPDDVLLEKVSKVLEVPFNKLKGSLNKAQQKYIQKELDIIDFMQLYNEHQPILVKILRGSERVCGELFPAIIATRLIEEKCEQEENEMEFVVIYDYNGVLELSDYGKKWIAYRFHRNLLLDKYG